MLFGIPGGGASLSLIDALEKLGIPFHLTNFEGSGALMAATVGHLSRRAGVSLSIKGPGLANAIPGLAVAWFENYPLVHVAEAYMPNGPLSQAHKRLDHMSLVRSVTKGARYFGAKGGFTSLARYALDEAPGPVLMNLAPKEVGTMEGFFEPPAAVGELAPALGLIARSKTPIVIAGTACMRAGMGAALVSLPCPVFTTAAAKGLVDETAPNAGGVYTGVGLALTPESVLLPRADLIVGVGLTAKEVLAAKPFGKPYLAVDTIQSPGSEAFAPQVRVGMDGITDICEALKSKPLWGFDELRVTLDKLRDRMGQKFLPASVFDAIAERLGRRVRMVMDTGNFCTIGEHAWLAPDPMLCLLSGQGRYMGAGLPMALGASLFDPVTPTVAVLGDGGIGMYLSEVKLAVRHNLPLLVVLMTDNGFGSIRIRAIKDGLTQKPLTMDGSSWTSVLESLGIPSVRAESLSAVHLALAKWEASKGPAFLEIPFKPEDYDEMVKDIR